MFIANSVSGTCIASAYTLRDRNVFPKNREEFYDALIRVSYSANRIILFVLHKESEEFGKLLLEEGLVEVGEYAYTGILNGYSGFVNDIERRIRELRNEAQRRPYDRIEVGDHVLFRHDAGVHWWNGGECLVVTEFVTGSQVKVRSGETILPYPYYANDLFKVELT